MSSVPPIDNPPDESRQPQPTADAPATPRTAYNRPGQTLTWAALAVAGLALVASVSLWQKIGNQIGRASCRERVEDRV